MDAMVTARVPSEVREQGAQVLREIGANTTDLVNSAFRYVIRERKLPNEKESAMLKSGKRVFSKEQADSLKAFLRLTEPSASIEDGRSFKEALDAAMGDRYADLYRH